MLEKGKYEGFSNKQIVEELRSQGHNPILFPEEPNTHLDPHIHPQGHILVVIDGEMKVRLEDKEVKVSSGDQITIDSEVEHAAYFGENGCNYFWVEF